MGGLLLKGFQALVLRFSPNNGLLGITEKKQNDKTLY